MARIMIAGLCFAFFLACAAGPADEPPAIQVEGVIIENKTLMWVSAVRLMVPITGRFVSCGNISPQSMCSTTFPEASYTGNPVEVTWSQGGQIYSTGQFVLRVPEKLDFDKPVIIRVVITAPGSAGAIFEQVPG